MISPEVTSSLVILTTCAFIIRGLLSYMAQSARSTNADYMTLRRQYEKKDTELVEIKSDRDLWKLKAMKYSDERNNAIRYAKYWREEARKAEIKLNNSPLPPSSTASVTTTQLITAASTTTSDVSGVMRFELEELRQDIETTTD